MFRSRNEIVIEKPYEFYFPETGKYVITRMEKVAQQLERTKTWRRDIVGDRDGDMMDEPQLMAGDQDETRFETEYRQSKLDLRNVPETRSPRNLPVDRIDLGDVVSLTVEVRHGSSQPGKNDLEFPERIVLGKLGDAIYLRGKEPFDGKHLDIVADEAPLAREIMGQEVGFDFEVNDGDFFAKIRVIQQKIFQFP